MKFRNATFADLPRIVEIYNSTVAGRMVTADTENVTVESREQWFHKHTGNRPLWVIEEGPQSPTVIGFVSLQSFYGRPAYDGTAEISIYLDEKVRGKGLGKLALQHCIDKCGELKIKTLLGFIFAHNAPSLKIFRAFGFKDWAMLPDIAVLDGVERSLVIVGKRINP